MATISAMVHTVSVSRDGKVKLERVDVAHETGFGLVNPLSVKKQIEGQITWFYTSMSSNRPSTPKVGMPALRRKRPSVAPVLITGTTGTPGNIDFTMVSVGVITSSRSTAGLLGVASSTSEI